MEIKIVCDCGQKFKFDVEPVGGRMPWEVNCPVCGASGTDKANSVISQQLTNALPSSDAPSTITPVDLSAESAKPRLTIRRAEQPAAPPPPVAPVMPHPLSSAAGLGAKPKPKIKPIFGEPHMGKTVLGACIGSLVVVTLWVILFKATGIKWGIMAMGVGWSAGFFARWIGRSEGQGMALVTALIALVSIISFQAWRASTEMSFSENDIDELYAEELKDAKELIALIPNGTDEEIRAYIKHDAQEDGEMLTDAEVTKEYVELIRQLRWQPAKDLVDGKKTKEDYRKEIRDNEEEFSQTTVYRIIFWVKAIGIFNIFFIAAGVGLAYKFGYGEG